MQVMMFFHSFTVNKKFKPAPGHWKTHIYWPAMIPRKNYLRISNFDRVHIPRKKNLKFKFYIFFLPPALFTMLRAARHLSPLSQNVPSFVCQVIKAAALQLLVYNISSCWKKPQQSRFPRSLATVVEALSLSLHDLFGVGLTPKMGMLLLLLLRPPLSKSPPNATRARPNFRNF